MTFIPPAFLHDNRFDDAAPAASTTDAGAVENLLDWRPHTIWRPTTMPATVTVDCGSAKAADYALIGGHDLATQSATVEIRGSTDNFSASDVLVATATPAVDGLTALYFASASYRYWRVRVTGASAPTLGIAAIGARLDVPAGVRIDFDPVGRVPQGTFQRSVAGNPMERLIDYELWSASLQFDLVTWTWLRDSWQPAWDAHLRSTPFGFCWNPTTYPAETRLARAIGGYQSPHKSGGWASLILDVDSQI